MILDAELLERTLRHAETYLAGLEERHVGAIGDPAGLRVALTDEGVPAAQVVDELVAAAEPGLIASPGPRYFGFVTGGALPAALAADWLAAAWDQNAAAYPTSPAAAVAEEVAERWLLDVLGLPETMSVGMVTGGQGANTTCLAVARNEVLRRVGWDVARQGLNGAPRIDVLVGEEAHATIYRALRFLGLGEPRTIPVDGQGRIVASGIPRIEGPAIVCAQAGNVNTGAFDPLEEIAAARGDAWLHVDGAFGLWAAASPSRRHLVAGAEHADSLALDAHKWLNVPYDSGLAVVADREAHLRTFALTAAYLFASEQRERDPAFLTPESSRRARGFAIYAALRQLGRNGLAALVDRCCEHAALMARLLSEGGVRILNEVVLNQVLAELDDATIARIQAEGTLWASPTTWQGHKALRISISGWATTTADIERSAAAILAKPRPAGSLR
jgi:glutamate/tyrosine decarboxylase-like PLP-dependent enzyme